MIEEIKKFMENFFNLELDARNVRNYEAGEIVTQKLQLMYDECDESLSSKIGVAINPNNEYTQREEFKHLRSEFPRHIFKISEYKNSKYGELYAVYTSIYLSDEDVASILEMNSFFIVLKQADKYQICLLYTSPSPRDQRGSRMPSSA